MSHYSGQVPATRRAADWRDAAPCRSEDPELFFPTGETGPTLLAIEQAKAVCNRCPSAAACLAFALGEGIQDGIFGGLTGPERRSLRRRLTRRSTTNTADKSPPRERTFQSVFAENTTRRSDGHLMWTGGAQVTFHGHAYTPLRVAFLADRGRQPVGRVLGICGVDGCVLPSHVGDDEERTRCGSRGGYHRHLREGTQICRPCREANSDADRRLRTTGTSKAAA